MIALIAAALSDLSSIRTWQDFANRLLEIHAASGHSYSDLERLSRHSDRELKRSTVSDVLHGKRRVARPLLESLLEAWELGPDARTDVLSTWARIATEARRRPGSVARFDEMSPRELGVHPAIRSADATAELPSYVVRHFDPHLDLAVNEGVEHGCFVLLVGRSSTGKTRSLYEAICRTVPNWRVAQPTNTRDVLDLAGEPAENTIVWLDEMHRFLGASPPLTRRVVSQLKRAGMIVVGTLWSDEFTARKELRPVDGFDRHADDRDLLELAEVINVRDTFDAVEQATAQELSECDSRIRIALRSRDAGMTQVLAAGPDLVHRWEQAPPYAWAAMTAAADARRLGVHTALSPNLLCDAMTGYLTPADRVTPPSTWLAAATTYGKEHLHGKVTALSPVAGPRSGLAGYVAADYLVQHVARVRRTQCPPDSVWTALIDQLDNANDLRRLCTSATARMRYRHWERGLRRLCALGDTRAHLELAELLTRQDRISEAMAALRDRLDDDETAEELARIIALRGRAEQLRSGDACGPELLDLLFDSGMTADLRERAAAKEDSVAADDLAHLLADRGAVAELRALADAGHRLAADLFAELLATHRRITELRERAQAGDEAAAHRLSKIEFVEDEPDGAAVHAQIAELRVAVDDGTRHAAEMLTSLLFELRREQDLRAEVEAGTPYAVERLLALLTAERCDDPVAAGHVLRLRAFGLDTDAEPADPGGPP